MMYAVDFCFFFSYTVGNEASLVLYAFKHTWRERKMFFHLQFYFCVTFFWCLPTPVLFNSDELRYLHNEVCGVKSSLIVYVKF